MPKVLPKSFAQMMTTKTTMAQRTEMLTVNTSNNTVAETEAGKKKKKYISANFTKSDYRYMA